jgi:manganese transport protein
VQNRRGPRAFERVIVALMLVIAIGFTAGIFFSAPDAAKTAAGLVPRFEGTGSVLLAASILGATIMPHAIYAHSALARDRFPQVPGRLGAARLLSATRWDVAIALVIAGAVNLVILLLAASALHGTPGTDSLEGAYRALEQALGGTIATVFAVGLLASGLASTSVGAYAGAEIMPGLLHLGVPILARGLVTLLPALVILGAGIDPTWALVLSQVALSFGIPFALIPLVWVTAQRRVMSGYVNRWYTTAAGAVCCALLVALNLLLVLLLLLG